MVAGIDAGRPLEVLGELASLGRLLSRAPLADRAGNLQDTRDDPAPPRRVGQMRS
jgi:hypothetical protein